MVEVTDLAAAERTGAAFPLARAWPRYFARLLDVSISLTVLGVLAGVCRPSLFEPGGVLSSRWAAVALGTLLLPLAQLVDAGLYAAFGNTPGKAIAGLRVLDFSGHPLSFRAYLVRNARLYVSGLACGIPLFTIVSLLISAEKAMRGAALAWDRESPTLVSGRGGALRVGLTAAIFVAMKVVGTVYSPAFAELRAPGVGGDQSPQGRMQSIADEINAAAPLLIDEQTQLDGAEVGPDSTLIYNYTLTRPGSGALSAQVYEGFAAELSAALPEQTCADAALLELLQLGTTIRFRYRDPSGATVVAIDVEPAQCAEAASPTLGS